MRDKRLRLELKEGFAVLKPLNPKLTVSETNNIETTRDYNRHKLPTCRENQIAHNCNTRPPR